MAISPDNSPKGGESATQGLKPMWSPLFNLGLAAFVGVIAAVVAFASTNDLRDGGTLISIPIGLIFWFVGDIFRWRGRYPMRLFLMIPIFVALVCAVSIRFVQKANQRRIAWSSMIEAGAIVKFSTVNMNGWVQYDEGIFLPAFLQMWLGEAVFADSAEVEIPMVSFAVDSPDSRRLGALDLERLPKFSLRIGDSRNNSKIDMDVFSHLVNSGRVEYPEVHLYEPSEETMKALKAIKRPFYLNLSGALSEKSMRHLATDSPVQFIILAMNESSGQTSWLNFLPSSPNCRVMALGPISASSLRTIDPEKPLCKLNFQEGLDDDAILELVKLTKAQFISMQSRGNIGSQASMDALFKSPVSMELGPVSLTPESVQLLIDNVARTKLQLFISSIDSDSFRRLAEVKCLKSVVLGFELTEQDLQSIALFPTEVDFTVRYDTNRSQLSQVEAAINNRRR